MSKEAREKEWLAITQAVQAYYENWGNPVVIMTADEGDFYFSAVPGNYSQLLPLARDVFQKFTGAVADDDKGERSVKPTVKKVEEAADSSDEEPEGLNEITCIESLNELSEGQQAYADTTLPDSLYLSDSRVKPRHRGVFCSTRLYKDQVFGPCSGVVIEDDLDHTAVCPYTWALTKSGDIQGYLHLGDPSLCNWLAFITFADAPKKANLVAFQSEGLIYYRVFRDMQAGEELLVSYGYLDKVRTKLPKVHSVDEDLECPECSQTATVPEIHYHRLQCHHVPLPQTLAEQLCDTSSDDEGQGDMDSSFQSWSLDMQDLEMLTGELSPTSGNVKKRRGRKPKALSEMKGREPRKVYRGDLQPVQLLDRSSGLSQCKSEDGGESVSDQPVMSRLMNPVSDETVKTGIKFICPHCKEVFRTMGYLNMHLEKHKNKQPYKCRLCKIGFRTLKLLTVHTTQRHGGVMKPEDKDVVTMELGDEVITVKFPNEDGDEQEEVEVKVEKEDASAAEEEEEWAVEEVEGEEGFADQPLMCQVCHICFSTEELLAQHNVVHVSGKAFKCSQCGMMLESAYDLSQHQIKHKRHEQHFECMLCEQSFSTERERRKHQKTHMDGTAYKCEQCGKNFTRANKLANHVRTHTKEKPYQCQFCFRSFSELGTLKNHIMLHTGQKPYMCQYCHKKFHILQNLKHHEMIHEGVKNYECSQCSKKFTQWHHLKRHERTHTNAKPFVCSLCNKAYRDKVSLMRHEERHEESRMDDTENKMS